MLGSVPYPYYVNDNSIESQVKSIDFDDQIDVLLYELALTDIAAATPASTIAASTTSVVTTKAAPPLIVTPLPADTPAAVVAAVAATVAATTSGTTDDTTVTRAVEFLAGAPAAKRGTAQAVRCVSSYDNK